ncbi:MAG: metal ABC transporter permease [Bacteroidetes bacterium]|nr:metal ABC transporter permease [Bacteroidota bacterium]
MTYSLLLYILLGLGLVGAMSGAVGTFAFLKKRTLVGDAVSHSILPGLVIGYLLMGTKDPYVLILSGTIFGLISIRSIDLIHQKSKLSIDTAIAIVTTVYFALGSVLLSVVAKSPNGSQAGLKDFLFGKAATLTENDIVAFAIVFVLVIITLIVLFKPFQSIAFSADFAGGQGWKVKRFEFILAVLTSIVITTGLQAVGVVLMSALLIGPGAIARYWTNSLKKMLLLSVVVGAFSGIAGGLLSLSKDNMPTGPWVIIVLFTATILTLLFAPKKGWLAIQSRNRLNKKQMAEENLLKTIEQLREKGNNKITFQSILDQRRLEAAVFDRAFSALSKKGMVKINDQIISLTELGVAEAQRIVRLHRLWEMYLTARLNFKNDHIHGTAETIEHLITADLEKVLMEELNFPSEDPHQKPIPYGNAKQ